MMARYLLVATLALVAAEGDDHDDHDHHARELCACAALEEDHPFTIDCSNTAAIRAADAGAGGD